MTDLAALKKVVVADLGDDTAQLAYADCLREHGLNDDADYIQARVSYVRSLRDRLAEMEEELAMPFTACGNRVCVTCIRKKNRVEELKNTRIKCIVSIEEWKKPAGDGLFERTE